MDLPFVNVLCAHSEVPALLHLHEDDDDDRHHHRHHHHYHHHHQAATSSKKQEEVPALSLGLFTSDRPLERVVGQLVQHRPEVSLEAAGLVELLHRRVDHRLRFESHRT